MSFTGQLRSFGRNTGIKFDTVLRKVVIDITSDIVRMTPVDTGHARSNYFWGVQRVSAIDETKHGKGAPSFARAFTFASSVKAGGVCYITNNLPYIMKLEYGGIGNGGSRQAPNGMARIVVARWQEIVNKAVGKMSQSARLEAIDSTNEQRGFKR